MLTAYAGYRYALDLNGPGFVAQAVFTALVVLVPVNILIALAYPERGVVLGGALVAFFIAFEWVASPAVFAAFLSAAGAVLLVAVLQESHRLAFSDELTGLPPSRRALQERLPALGPVCAVAMVDIDHFKQFNGAHGHDVGDQVLRLVAARLAEVGGGGTAHRYGGEEFCVLFDGARSPRRCRIWSVSARRSNITGWQCAARTGPKTRRPAASVAPPKPSANRRTRRFRSP